MKKKKCPYCGRRVPYSVAFSRRRKAEYVCKNCGRESRVVINRSVILAFIICAIISIAIFVLWVYLKLTYNPLGIVAIAVPLIIFTIISPRFVRFEPLRKYKKTMEAKKAGKTEISEPKDPEPMTPVRKIRHFSADEPLHIALVLPFNVNGNSASNTFLNFYAGALMAVREQKDKGAHLVLNVFDLAKGANAILSDSSFQQSDLVVGPVEAGTIAPFLAFSDENGVPLVSPLDHKVDSLVDSHPFLFQVPASPAIQIENLVRSLKARSDETVILIGGTAEADARLTEQM